MVVRRASRSAVGDVAGVRRALAVDAGQPDRAPRRAVARVPRRLGRRDDAGLDVVGGRPAEVGVDERRADVGHGLLSGRPDRGTRRSGRTPADRSPWPAISTRWSLSQSTIRKVTVVVDWSQLRQSPTANTSPPLGDVPVVAPGVVGPPRRRRRGRAVRRRRRRRDRSRPARSSRRPIGRRTGRRSGRAARRSWSGAPSRRSPGSPCPGSRRARPRPRTRTPPRAPPGRRRHGRPTRPALGRLDTTSARQHTKPLTTQIEHQGHERREVEHAGAAAGSAAAARAAARSGGSARCSACP